jgi:hypothetical protein
MVNLSRITATKYIHELIGEGRVYQRKVGAAKLCYAKKRFVEIVKEKEILDKIKKKMD